MATTLPTTTTADREIVGLLRHQSLLLGNIARSIAGGNNPGEKSENTSPKNIISSFIGKFGMGNQGPNQIEVKTLKETQIVRNSSEMMARDIAFIRRAFEENQKIKDRALLAEEISKKEKKEGGLLSSVFKIIGLAVIGKVVWDILKPYIEPVINKAKEIYKTITGFFTVDTLTSVMKSAFEGLKQIIVDGFNSAIESVKNMLGIKSEEDDIPEGQREFVMGARDRRDEIVRKQFNALPMNLRAEVEGATYPSEELKKEDMERILQNERNRLEELGNSEAGLSEEESILLEYLKLIEQEGIEKKKELLKQSEERNESVAKQIELQDGINKKNEDNVNFLEKLLDNTIEFGKQTLDYLGDKYSDLGKLNLPGGGEVDLLGGIGSSLKNALKYGQEELENLKEDLPGKTPGMFGQINQNNIMGNQGSSVNFPSAITYNTHPSYVNWVQSTKLS